MKLSFADVKKKIGEHLKIALNVEEFSITFAKQEEEVWKINVEFAEKACTMDPMIIAHALFSIDITTGEVKKFERGHYWQL